MKKILGLDLGTNSIGHAVITALDDKVTGIESSGSRIIPMDAAKLGDFGRGNTVSQTVERTKFRSTRRLTERRLLRRQRLHRVLSVLGSLPEHYAEQIDEYGHFKNNCEPKLTWNNGKFLFMSSFEQMLSDFKTQQPGLFVKEDAKIPYDWTIYYLRKKAVTQRIELGELAWILLNFNQKRGYYQLRGEDEKKSGDKKEEYHALRVVSVEVTDQKKGNDVWYNVHLENGWTYRRTSSTPLDWVGKVKEFIVTTETEEDGTLKKNRDGEVKMSFRAPKDDDWSLLKNKTENEIQASQKTIGEYIYDTLLQVPDQKVRGKLIRVVERNYYKEELIRIFEKQREFHAELNDESLYKNAIEELYRSNNDYRKSIEGRDFQYLIIEDVLFYQRPLKTKKSLIANCKYESYSSGEKVYGLKAMSKSHPLYQEFRLWKFVSQLKIFHNDVDVTPRFLVSDDDYVALFEWLDGQKEIDNKGFIKYKRFNIPKSEQQYYRWNYVVDKKYPCNETLSGINSRLKRQQLPPLDKSVEVGLWHILYSVKDLNQIKKALAKFARKHQYDAEKFVTALKGCVFENDYGAYSEKAIKKLLPLIRRGRYWSEEAIDVKTRERIGRFVDGVFDETIDERSREKCKHLNSVEAFCGLEEWLASYVVYGRHSESATACLWEKPEDIDDFLETFQQHSMRNPIVEQVVVETLRVVRDVWRKHGRFDEIHIELAREMKKTKDERVRDTQRITDNENTNYRIRMLLEELHGAEYNIEDLRAFSPSHQEIFKIYEEFAFTQGELPDDIKSICSKFNERDAKKQPTKGEIIRYKLWLEQKYRSPYTGEIIPLSQLFTPAYEIEHIIPRVLYTDNSLSNKVICEAAVNVQKDRLLGMQFIKKHHGEKITLAGGRVVTIFNEAEYLEHIERYYSKNRRKSTNLKAEEILQEFTSSQLNNTRYISRYISGLLSNIVRVEGEVESISKNVIITSGGVTDTLKREWGINDVWNDLVAPRFERLNDMTASSRFGERVCVDGKRFFRTQIPLDLSKGFSKKRIDHRHHAMDAIIIACTTRAHINYLNNISAKEHGLDVTRLQLRNNICYKHKIDAAGQYQWRFFKPWESFTQDTRESLGEIIVSFKSNQRVVNRATNRYQRFINGEKCIDKQQGENWAIRKSLHKDTVFGVVNLRSEKPVQLSEAIKSVESIVDKQLRSEIKKLIEQGVVAKKIANHLKEKGVTKINIYYFSDDTSAPIAASRKAIGAEYDSKKIESITDSGIRKIMLAHLERNNNDPAIAFSPDGIEEMNLNIAALNGGVSHKPIYKVRVAETLGCKFSVGNNGNKSKKYVEANKGTNLFLAIYQNAETEEREYESIPLNIVIENQKNRLPSVPQVNEKGVELRYVLSPNDLVYVPTPDQLGRPIVEGNIDKERIYKMVSCGEKRAFFVPHTFATVIVDKVELLSGNKMERAITGEMIKQICIPIKVDRLGNIIKIEQ